MKHFEACIVGDYFWWVKTEVAVLQAYRQTVVSLSGEQKAGRGMGSYNRSNDEKRAAWEYSLAWRRRHLATLTSPSIM